MDRPASSLFVAERAVGFRGIVEVDPAFLRAADQADHGLPVGGRAVGLGHAHAAKAQRRYLKRTVA